MNLKSLPTQCILIISSLFSTTCLYAGSNNTDKQLDYDRPYCEDLKFALSYLFLPTLGFCVGTPKVQFEASLVGPVPFGAEIGASYTLTPEQNESLFYGLRLAGYSFVSSGIAKTSTVVGYNFGSFFIEGGPAYYFPSTRHDSHKINDDEPENFLAFDLKIGWD